MKVFTIIIIAAILVAVLFESCYYDKRDLLYPGSKAACDTSVVAKFSADVMPVLNAGCNSSGCHNTAGASAGVILDTYAGVKTQADNGRLMGSINQTGSYSAMPKNAAKLPDCTIQKIQQWIHTGSPNN